MGRQFPPENGIVGGLCQGKHCAEPVWDRAVIVRKQRTQATGCDHTAGSKPAHGTLVPGKEKLRQRPGGVVRSWGGSGLLWKMTGSGARQEAGRGGRQSVSRVSKTSSRSIWCDLRNSSLWQNGREGEESDPRVQKFLEPNRANF